MTARLGCEYGSAAAHGDQDSSQKTIPTLPTKDREEFDFCLSRCTHKRTPLHSRMRQCDQNWVLYMVKVGSRKTSLEREAGIEALLGS